jgi:hypothetical protein
MSKAAVPITPGSRVYVRWEHWPRRAVSATATVLIVHPHTAAIRYRCQDGHLRRRWIKLARLRTV